MLYLQVDGATTQYRTKCMCNHLTSFGSDFVVPVNTIDFSTVFSLENFIEAIPVFVTVSLVLLLYVVSLIWARHMDKKDVAKVREHNTSVQWSRNVLTLYVLNCSEET